MKIAILTNEYPPRVYGGAGVHVGHLTRALAALGSGRPDLEILCFGGGDRHAANLAVRGVQAEFPFAVTDARHAGLLQTLLKNLVMTGSLERVDLVHCHTWYTHLAGCLLKQLLGIPLVLTTHSLEPQRPWKAEQLGSGYRVSTWIEKTAYQNADGIIAVSEDMASAVTGMYSVPVSRVRVIPNGIDLKEFRPVRDPEILRAYGIDPERPFLLFVGRITLQKGWSYLLEAVPALLPGTQVVLCAASPDTERAAQTFENQLKKLKTAGGSSVIWIPRVVPRDDLVCLYSQAAVFVCPSIYEPFGIINLEAMACETPVVASSVGGIREVVLHDETGLLVPFAPVNAADPRPRDPQGFSHDLAAAINRLLADPEQARAMGRSGRRRVERLFSWKAVAGQTLDFYEALAAPSEPVPGCW